MNVSTIDTAKRLMARRDFGSAIKLLQSKAEVYEASFDYYCTLGIACLYIGDSGAANYNFELARKIKLQDSNLLLGQAAIFLRRGETDRAVQYYLDIQVFDPQNPIAKDALEFIRTKGDYETICKWADSGKLEQFYPPLEFNPKIIGFVACAVALGIIFGIAFVNIFTVKNVYQGKRGDLSELALTTEEEKSPQEKDISKNLVKYILSDREIKTSYRKAAEYFHSYNDNAAQVEINRILNSNASTGIRQKARLLMDYLQEPTFDSLKDNYEIAAVKEAPELYLDCFVDWSGRVANLVQSENNMEFTLLVGYEDQKNVSGTVIVKLNYIPNPELDTTKPVRILGRISLDGDKIYLRGKSVYQNINN
ncbi:MAG: hypothetical protein J6Y36_04015 [Treponema sp.]|nr:hypothetical protein [Treponema sp.]